MPDDVAQPRVPGDRLEAPGRERAPQPPGKLRSAFEPAGRGPSSTWRSSSAKARAPSKRPAGPLGAAVAAGRGAGASSPSEPSAITATTAPTTSAAATPAMSMSLLPHGLVG